MNKRKILLALCTLWFLGLATPGWGQRREFGTIAASAANCTAVGGARVVLPLMANDASVLIVLSGTWAGTAEWFGTADKVNYVALNGEPFPSGASVSTATANGTWLFHVAGMTEICVRASAYTSGIINVLIRSTAAFAGKSSFTTTPSFLTMTEGEPLTVDASGVLTSSPAYLLANVYAGANAGAKIAAAYADLPSTGGTIDARGLEGAQSIPTTVTIGSATKPTTLILGAATYTGAAAANPMFDIASGSTVMLHGTTVTPNGANDAYSASGTVSRYGVNGLFTNLQMSSGIQSEINNPNILADFQVLQGANYATSAVVGAIKIPSTSTILLGHGIEGFASTASTTTYGIGGYFQGIATANNARVQGVNTAVTATAGLTGVELVGAELDVNVTDASTTGAGLSIHGAFTAQPTNFPAININKPGANSWSSGLVFSIGSATAANGAIYILQTDTGASQPSQYLVFRGMDAGSAEREVKLNGSLDGDLIITPVSGRGVGVGTTTPQGPLQVNVGDVLPAAAGNMDSGVIIAVSGGSVALNMGTRTTGGNHSWINSAFANNSGVSSNLVLQSQGGSVGIGDITPAEGTLTVDGDINAALYESRTNCADSAGAAACGAAPAGAFVIDAGGSTSTVVSTTAVTADSQVFLQVDSSLGTRLSVTCNTQDPGTFDIRVTARTAATSFTATVDATPTTNPLCVNYFIVN